MVLKRKKTIVKEIIMSSNVKRLQNEIITIEENSDSFIPYDHYYIIKVDIISEDHSKVFHNLVKEISLKSLSDNVRHLPLLVYVFNNTVYILYSCLSEGQTHFLKGSHQSLCSEYCSYFFNNITNGIGCTSVVDFKIKCNIIQLSTQTKVFVYFSWIVYQNSLNCMRSIDKLISERDTNSFPMVELIERMKKNGIDWEEIDNNERYGTFYKLERKKGGKLAIDSLSESLDAREEKRYINYMFC